MECTSCAEWRGSSFDRGRFRSINKMIGKLILKVYFTVDKQNPSIVIKFDKAHRLFGFTTRRGNAEVFFLSSSYVRGCHLFISIEGT